MRRVITRISASAGLTPSDVVYQREWLGQWVRDEEGLVYRIRKRNLVTDLPEANDWCYVLGMDVGFVDATAYVVWAYSRSLGQACVVESFQETRLLQAQQVAYVDRLALSYDFESIVVDPGGGGKQLVEELRQRHGLPAEVAEKQAKLAAVGTLNSDLAAGNVLVIRQSNEDLLHDLAQLKYNYAKLRRKAGVHWKMRPSHFLEIDDRTPDHLADAFLYGHRQCAHFLHGFEPVLPTEGTPEWVRLQEAALMAAAEERVDRRDKGEPWWASGPPPPRL